MIFNLLKFDNKKSARKFLQENCYLIHKKSSIYFIDEYVYIGILSSSLLFSNNLLVVNDSYEQTLSLWSHSELLDDIKFDEFENSAAVIERASIITFDDKEIKRSFQPLSEIMLIINVTPDSFSDGDKYNTLDLISTKVDDALRNGVTIIDIGAESTRPNADYVTVQDEILRLESVVDRLLEFKKDYDFQISLDTYKAEVIEYFLNKVDIINDVSNQIPLNLIKNITMSGKKYILMHSLTVPADPRIVLNNNIDVTLEILEWFQSRVSQYKEYGINLDNVIIDVGIGFNKTSIQSWCLLRNIRKFYQLGCEVLVGHSRKSFLNKITKNSYGNRDIETAIVSNYLANKTVDYLRIHEYTEYLLINSINNNLGIK